MGSDLTELESYTANVVGSDAGNLVTAASVRVMGTSLANRTKYLKAVVSDGTKTITCAIVICDEIDVETAVVTVLAQFSGTQTFTGTTTINSDATVSASGTLTTTGKMTEAGRRVRGSRVALTATTQTVNVSQGNRFELASNTTGSAKVITLKSTSPNIPDANETIEFICHTPGDGYTFKREDATTIASFTDNSTLTNLTCHAEFEFSGGVFRLGINSGSSYDGVAAFGVLPGSGA